MKKTTEEEIKKAKKKKHSCKHMKRMKRTRIVESRTSSRIKKNR